MPASLKRSAIDLMCQYADYHRDRRNIVTHFVGIPLIVFAIGVLLARVPLHWGGHESHLGWLFWAVSTAWYLSRGALTLGLATALSIAFLMALATPFATLPGGSWLSVGLGSFFIGWVFQFVGHYYEGRKPAFVDDLVGLLVGPMFVVGEALFALGWGKDMLEEIESRCGPTRLRDLSQPLT